MSEDEDVAAGAAAGAGADGAEAGALLDESPLDFDSPDFDSLLLPSPLLFALVPSPEDLGLALP